MRTILALSIMLMSLCCRSGAEGNEQKAETSTVVYRVIVRSVRQLQSERQAAECRYLEPGARWRIEFGVRAICDKNGWRKLPTEEKLVAAVRDAAGDFGLFTGDKEMELDLLVTKARQTGAIIQIYRAPPDLVPKE
jgi:hypothetical protein